MASFNEKTASRVQLAEKYVIGSVLLDPRCLDIAMEIVKPCDFVTQKARVAFTAMATLQNDGTPINLATVLSIAGNDPSFSDGGMDYLQSATMDLPSAMQIEHYCKIVQSGATQRRLAAFAGEILAKDWGTVTDTDAEVARLSDILMNLSEAGAVSPWSTFGQAVQSACEELLAPEDGANIVTGFIDLDSKLSLKPGSLTIVAARPAMGKTAFGLNIMRHIGIDSHTPVAFFSLEMTKESLVNRVISSVASVNGTAIQNRRMDDNEWNRFLQSVEQYRNAPIYIDETPALDIAILRERARRMKRQYNIGLLIVDYLQLMHADGKRINNREQEVATVSRGLKAVAKELHIPVISLAQLNRAVDSRADKRPVLSDLRESGSIEQDADSILFIHREDYYRRDEERDNTAEIIIAKQRSGPTGIVKLHWDGNFTRFSNLASDTFDGLPANGGNYNGTNYPMA